MVDLAKQIALPHEFSPQRFPSFPALERTAVMGFNAPLTTNIAAAASNKYIVTRQAAYPLWGPIAVGGAATCYGASVGYSLPVTPAVSGPAFTNFAAPDRWNVGNVAPGDTQVGISGSVAYLLYPVLGVDPVFGAAPFLYIPSYSGICGFHFVVSLTTVQAAKTFSLEYRVWDSPGEARVLRARVITDGTNRGAAVSLAINAESGIWVQFAGISTSSTLDTFVGGLNIELVASGPSGTYAGSTSSAGTLTLGTAPSVGILLPLMSPAEFSNSSLPWYSTRTTASAALFTNVTQLLNKGGTVLGGRVAPHVVSPWAVTQSYITGLHPAEKAFLPLETGVYTYVPPSTDMVGFMDYTLDTSMGAKPCPVHRLDNDSLVNILFLTATGAVESMAINMDWHIEFRTTSTLFQVGLSAITIEAFHQAQLALVSAGFFFENPTHGSILSRIAQTAGRIGRAAFAASAYVYPEVGAMQKGYRAAKSILLSNAPRDAMKTTSLAGSGMKKKPKPSPKKKAKPAAKKKR